MIAAPDGYGAAALDMRVARIWPSVLHVTDRVALATVERFVREMTGDAAAVLELLEYSTLGSPKTWVLAAHASLTIACWGEDVRGALGVAASLLCNGTSSAWLGLAQWRRVLRAAGVAIMERDAVAVMLARGVLWRP